MMGIGSFEFEGERRLRIDELDCPTENDRLEIGRSAAGQGSEQGVVSIEVDFSEIVMRQSLGVTSDPVGIEFFVAVSWVIGKRKVLVEKGGAVTNLIGAGCGAAAEFRGRLPRPWRLLYPAARSSLQYRTPSRRQ